jgi:hypothetical protein
VIESWNRDCFCVSLDPVALRAALDAQSQGLAALIESRCPNLFAALPVFVSRSHIDAMAEVIDAVEQTVALPGYRAAALAHAPDIARHEPGALGVFMGYDFHLGADGPRLIEINTNAGGALLNAVLGNAQRACCAPVAALVNGPLPPQTLERAFFDMFMAEWRHAGQAGLPRRVAIVDNAPERQFLYPEFVLFERLFRRFGIEAVIRAPEELRLNDGRLCDAGGVIDLVYNRLTDFALQQPPHAALRHAYVEGFAVLTPHPHAHALYADKRNLALLTDPARLRSWGVPAATLDLLLRGIAQTRVVSRPDAERLWSARRGLFFKPACGYGSKAAYRGDKLTRRVWEQILSGDYVAQELIAPSERQVAEGTALKVDVRNYVYSGRVQLLAARLYQGQTTNLRTAGGGFAPVLTTSPLSPDGSADPGALSARARLSGSPSERAFRLGWPGPEREEENHTACGG